MPSKEQTYEYYSIPAFQESRKPTIVKGKTILSQKKVLKDGMVLFGKLNPRVQKVWKVRNYSSNPKIGSGEWITIFPNSDEINSDYLYYLMWSQYVMPIAQKMVTGSTPSRKRVDPSSFYDIKVPIPPFPEQKNIAYILSTIQKARDKTEIVLNSLKDLKKSLMKHLFTYGPVSLEDANKVKLKETEIGSVPDVWKETRVKNYCKQILTGGTPRTEIKEY